MFTGDFNELAAPLVIKLLGVQPQCPACGAEMSAKVQRSFLAGQRVKCGSCDFYSTWRFGTILHGSRISNSQFLALFFKYTLPSDAPAIARQLGLDPATVRQWRDKLVTLARSQQ